MQKCLSLGVSLCLAVAFWCAADRASRSAERPSPRSVDASLPAPTGLDAVLAEENAGRSLAEASLVDDLGFLRRIYVDLIGRIPTAEEIAEYQALPAGERRAATIDKLLAHPLFADRWAVFFGDMLRIRSAAEGGAALAAWVHQAVLSEMPYDQMCRTLIAANGKANKTPEVGYVLNDGADPMALAAATSQVFLGVRISCAQCHDHPFDVWTREQFYGLAAYFGRTRRVESSLTRQIYTMEADDSLVLWPPEGLAPPEDRQPMQPAFPFLLDIDSPEPEHVARLVALREAQRQAAEAALAGVDTTVDDLLADAQTRVESFDGPEQPEELDVASESQEEAQALRVQDDLYRASELRNQLADLIVHPRNKFFSQALVNRVWKELLGRGFVEPIDDFSEANPASHPQTLEYISNEFVANGFNFRQLVRMVVLSQAYQRGHLVGVPQQDRQESEAAFVAQPMRRMLAESLFDSVVLAGHLFDYKYAPGENVKTVQEIVTVPVEREAFASELTQVEAAQEAAAAQMAAMPRAGSGYDLESAIEVDFAQVLADAQMQEEEAPELDMMEAESPEAMEARMMASQRRYRYIDQVVERTFDDNPLYNSAMRMAAPANPAHFLRVFGQPSRDALGEHRDTSPSMRQALMMLNGKLTHEASRVGSLEPLRELVEGPKADLAAAVKSCYLEILTREPSADELDEALAIIDSAETPIDGVADLRWVLFNCHEFRFLP